MERKPTAFTATSCIAPVWILLCEYSLEACRTKQSNHSLAVLFWFVNRFVKACSVTCPLGWPVEKKERICWKNQKKRTSVSSLYEYSTTVQLNTMAEPPSKAKPYDWENSTAASSELVQLWSEVGNGIDKSQQGKKESSVRGESHPHQSLCE